MASTHYDFVVVGSGPAGCAIAAGLAKSARKPSVLLLEAGPDYDDRNLRVDGQRWTTFKIPEMNWGYKTAPQVQCAGREMDYSRGFGLGGTSSINFGVYTTGSRDDYDEWARLVGDDTFRWEHMQQRYKDLETFNGELPVGVGRKYAAPKASDHGTSGPLKVGYAHLCEDDVPTLLDIFEDLGYPLNPDHNSGDPIGMSLMINSAHAGLRTTAKELITPKPNNLTVLTGTLVQRIIFQGNKAIGVESNGKKFFASKEVVLCAGTLNTPKILMHSGIGDPQELGKWQIPVRHGLRAVGKGLRDHMFAPLVYKRTEESTPRGAFYKDQKAMDEAMEQWKRDGTGLWTKYGCETALGFFRLADLASHEEFRALPAETQRFLLADTVPHYEVVTHSPLHLIVPGFPQDPASLHYMCILVFYYNAQSRGEVTLQSADPDVPVKVDPKYLDSPYDRRVAIEAMREVARVGRHEGFAKDTLGVMMGPKSESDEDILEHWRHSMSSSWHPTGTAKMGRPGDADAVVDSDFRVLGTEGLRIADMSVVPLMPNCHVQAVAYAVGVTCAEKLVKQYGLEYSAHL